MQSFNKYLASQPYLMDAALKWIHFNKSNMSDWSSFKIAIVQAYQSTITPFQSSTPSTTTTKTPSAASPGQVTSTFFDNDTSSKHQNQDFQIHKIKKHWSITANYVIDDYNVLYKVVNCKFGQHINLRYLSVSLIPSVLSTYHNSTFNGAHFGIKRTFYKIRDRSSGPNMYKDIEKHILSCLNCRQNKPSRRKPDGH
ncbi:unnamed protein product [Rotaria socialis]|uniref:Integrase zinc-binding domain-containing protein n=2 Tax=Rotaria socialis TaxID=392032 RepID=A0A817SKN5_9BILA|nr:unnamed protein product [Rotaria socialis]CAF3295685.1 unnamed protein product [Rotaria socialis]CAF3491111.1 unnamed protein product [Rotaria socialis]CAF3523002.1 unnamed protein product [Rotaria socialis]CAF4324230.1 unnamed protein product [Rotaria socialis]